MAKEVTSHPLGSSGYWESGWTASVLVLEARPAADSALLAEALSAPLLCWVLAVCAEDGAAPVVFVASRVEAAVLSWLVVFGLLSEALVSLTYGWLVVDGTDVGLAVPPPDPPLEHETVPSAITAVARRTTPPLAKANMRGESGNCAVGVVRDDLLMQDLSCLVAIF